MLSLVDGKLWNSANDLFLLSHLFSLAPFLLKIAAVAQNQVVVFAKIQRLKRFCSRVTIFMEIYPPSLTNLIYCKLNQLVLSEKPNAISTSVPLMVLLHEAIAFSPSSTNLFALLQDYYASLPNSSLLFQDYQVLSQFFSTSSKILNDCHSDSVHQWVYTILSPSYLTIIML